MFHGSMVALITPMHANGSVDFNSLSELIEWHISNQTDALVILGTTGESATINFAERGQVLTETVKNVRGRLPIIAGTGSNSTAETIRLTQHAMEMGVDACLLVTPYYNKPTQAGLYQHYCAVAKAVAIPQILYNVPSRTGCDLLPETVGLLTEVTNIIGLKEATGDISRVRKILDLCDEKIDLYSGDDATSLDFLLAGGKGVISVTANVTPQLMHDMCKAALSGNEDEAFLLQQRLMPLHTKLFVESNPIPVKWVLHEMGKIEEGIRLPLTPLSNSNHQNLRTALQQAGVV
ncbi:MAG: 4-hydroxy-tetrahydrodipicolinate synthase [Gammaproteobacteria bacterium]|nr:4-hydroxy-tetrahydrodipicolinate synthase [Gammaproteobacteria bacterium]